MFFHKYIRDINETGSRYNLYFLLKIKKKRINLNERFRKYYNLKIIYKRFKNVYNKIK